MFDLNLFPKRRFIALLLFIFPLFLSAQTIDLSKPVGTPSGSGAVSSSGASNYALPITLLPAANNMAPDIKLVYSNQGGDGVAGSGWNLSCASTITRVGKNNYYNGITAPVKYTNSDDAFLLDGQRLFLLSGSNGADGATYGMENESFSKVQSVGTAGAGPNYFRVTMKNGTTLEYGNDGSAKMPIDGGSGTVMIWYLNKITDVNGNVIKFLNFVNPTDRSYSLSEIQYGGNPNSPMPVYNRVVFDYIVRNGWDKTTTYDAGASIRNAFLLTGIRIFNVNGQTVRSYSFTQDLVRNQYFLKTMTEKGSDGTGMNPIVFTYGSNTAAPDVTESIQYPNMHQGNVYAGDFNGDGKQDVLSANYYYDNNNIPHYTSYDVLSDFGTYAGQPAISFYYNYQIPQTTYAVEVQNSRAYNPKLNYSVVGTFDYDGDSKEDVLMINSTVSGSDRMYSGLSINYSRNYNVFSGPTYENAVYNSIPHSPLYVQDFRYFYRSGTTFGSYFVPGDFDGDGAEDYILILGINSSNAFKGFFCSPKKGIFNQEIANFGVEGTASDPFYANSVASARQLIPFDFDGDGKQEILVVKDAQSYVLTIFPVSATSGFNYAAQTLFTTAAIKSNYPIFPGDFNGDGKNDLLFRSANTDANATWYTMISTGTSFVQQVFNWANRQYLPQDGAGSANHLMVADLNGDGRTDVWQSLDVATPQQSRHNLYFSTGLSFTVESYYSTYGINGSMQANTVAGDFNGDGKPDILGINASSQGRFIYPRPFKEERFMTSAVNGLGGQQGFSYTLTNDGVTYNRSVNYQYDVSGTPIGSSANGNPYNVLSIPLYVVNQSFQSDGIGGMHYNYYQYADAAFHRIRGFLGYKKVSGTDGATGTVATTENDIDADLLVSHTVHQSSTLNGNTVADTKFTDVLHRMSTSFLDKRYYRQVLSAVSYNGVTDAASEVDNTYDAYGNVTQSITKIGSLSGTVVNPVETTTTTTVFGTHNTPYPASPESITAQVVRNGQSAASKVTTYAYNTIGSISSKTEFAGKPGAITTNYTYDNFGNITQSDITASGLATRTQKFKYDQTGALLIQQEALAGSLDKKIVYSYEPLLSNLASKTTSDGLTTTFQYDALGRLITTNLPEGYAVSRVYGWESAYGRYSISTTRPGGGRNTKIYYDILMRPVRTENSGFGGQVMVSSSAYNSKGQPFQTVAAHFNSETPVTTTSQYDNFGQVTQVSNGTSTTTYSYAKLSGALYQKITTIAGNNSIQTTDATGKVVIASDNGGSMNYSYNSQGLQSQVSLNGTTVLSKSYDDYGYPTGLQDKNAGSYSYIYDVFGELTSQTTPTGATTTSLYDAFGRITSRTGPEGVTTYEYWKESTTGYCNDNPTKTTGFGGDIEEYAYDNLRRLQTATTTVDGTAYITQFGYDAYSNLNKTTYPSGVVITRNFDHDGSETAVNLGEGSAASPLFTATSMNSLGMYTGYNSGNGKSSTESYDLALGALTASSTAGVENMSYSYDPQTGNLMSRKDMTRNLEEVFTYDNLNRLLTTKLNGVQQIAVGYDGSTGSSLGNIVTKTDAGNYVYNNDKNNAVAYVTNPAGAQTPPSVISQQQQDISYTPFQKTATVAENGYLLSYTYGSNFQRIKGILQQSGVTVETRYYIGAFERQIKAGATRDIHYIKGGNGMCAILVKEGGATTAYFTYSDHLGSITTVTDGAGTVIASQNFDAWGRRRNPTDWGYANIPARPDWLYRGFTGLEYLDQFALINMNGRMYDPTLGRMLGPDEYVWAPGSSQGYNRYAYAANNPLFLSDPDGKCPICVVVIIGAIVGGIVNTVTHWDAITSGGSINWGALGTAFGVGAVSGAVGAFTGGTTLAAIGITGFFGGAISAAVGTAFSGLIQGIGNQVTFGDPYSLGDWGRDIIFGAVTGGVISGVSSAIAGNNFWDGSTNFAPPKPSTINTQLEPIPENDINTSNALSGVGDRPPSLNLSDPPGVYAPANTKPTITIDDDKVLGKIMEHGFSAKHVADGLDQTIVNLGSPEGVAQRTLRVIHTVADQLVEGPNNIITTIGGTQVTVRAFVQNSTVISANIFPGVSDRAVKNIFWLWQ
jgi:RHS repeat-associated protein